MEKFSVNELFWYRLKDEQPHWTKILVGWGLAVLNVYILSSSFIKQNVLASIFFTVVMFMILWWLYRLNFIRSLFQKIPKHIEVRLLQRTIRIPVVYLIIGFIILRFLLAVLSVLIAYDKTVASSNPPTSLLNVLSYAWIDLVGEDFLRIIFVLPVTGFLLKFVKPSIAFLIGSLIGSICFGLAHYQTYQGQLYQLIITIGIKSSIDFFVVYKTRTIWTLILIHILYDYILFLIA